MNKLSKQSPLRKAASLKSIRHKKQTSDLAIYPWVDLSTDPNGTLLSSPSGTLNLSIIDDVHSFNYPAVLDPSNLQTVGKDIVASLKAGQNVCAISYGTFLSEMTPAFISLIDWLNTQVSVTQVSVVEFIKDRPTELMKKQIEQSLVSEVQTAYKARTSGPISHIIVKVETPNACVCFVDTLKPPKTMESKTDYQFLHSSMVGINSMLKGIATNQYSPFTNTRFSKAMKNCLQKVVLILHCSETDLSGTLSNLMYGERIRESKDVSKLEVARDCLKAQINIATEKIEKVKQEKNLEAIEKLDNQQFIQREKMKSIQNNIRKLNCELLEVEENCKNNQRRLEVAELKAKVENVSTVKRDIKTSTSFIKSVQDKIKVTENRVQDLWDTRNPSKLLTENKTLVQKMRFMMHKLVNLKSKTLVGTELFNIQKEQLNEIEELSDLYFTSNNSLIESSSIPKNLTSSVLNLNAAKTANICRASLCNEYEFSYKKINDIENEMGETRQRSSHLEKKLISLQIQNSDSNKVIDRLYHLSRNTIQDSNDAVTLLAEYVQAYQNEAVLGKKKQVKMLEKSLKYWEKKCTDLKQFNESK